MSGDVTIDFGSAVPYVVDRALALFGQDAHSSAVRDRLKRRIETGALQASTVQCVGMDHPISIEDIYQPTRLRRTQVSQAAKPYPYSELLAASDNAIIWGPPG
jgi:hypothetical protein